VGYGPPVLWMEGRGLIEKRSRASGLIVKCVFNFFFCDQTFGQCKCDCVRIEG